MHTEPTPISRVADGTPERLGRYRLVRPISTGGMARVFEARRESLAGVSPRVAIKVILPDYADNRPFQELFVHEARIGSMLQHQNVVQIQDFDCQDGVYYLVMEYVDGITLRRIASLCRRHGVPMPLDVIAELGRQACDGLAHAHEAKGEDGNVLNLVHRDIKPSNLMINPQGVVKVLDFGISKALTRREQAGAVRGTWGYMSPEQAEGETVAAAADQFGLAAVLYELAAVSPLFSEKEPDVVREQLGLDEAARRAARLPREYAGLAPVLVRALQRDSAARFPSTLAMGRALSDLIKDPVMARENLVRFQERMVALNRPGVTDRTANAVNIPRPDTDPASLTSQYTDPSAAGLPIAIGDDRGPVRPVRRTEDQAIEPLISVSSLGLPMFVLLAIAILGYTAWNLWQERDPTVVKPAVPVEMEAEITTLMSEEAQAPVEIVAPPPAPPTPEVAVEPTPAPEVAPPAEQRPPIVESGEGLLTVSTLPRAKVYVDGEYQKYSPLFKVALNAGEHEIRLVTDDGREHTFSLYLRANRELNRIWSFDDNDWVGP